MYVYVHKETCNRLNWFWNFECVFFTHSKNFWPAATSSHQGRSMTFAIT